MRSVPVRRGAGGQRCPGSLPGPVRCAACPVPVVRAGGSGSPPGGPSAASRRTPVMAAASAGPRVNRRTWSRSGCAGVTAVTVPSAATWQVIPAGQLPSRTAAAPGRRPECRMPASRRAADGAPAAAISVAAGPASPWLASSLARAQVSRRTSISSRAASSDGGTDRPGIAAGSVPGSSLAASAAGMMIAAGSPAGPGGAWASRLARIARAAASAPGPARPRPAARMVLASARLPSARMPSGTAPAPGPGGGNTPGPVPGGPGGALASCRSGYGSAAGASPGSGPVAGSCARAARRRVRMTSGSGGVSGCRPPGSPGRGR